MATWKKVIVSGSLAHLASVTASIGVFVGTNQITTAQSTTFLTGSFTGSFTGNGALLTNVPVSFGSITGLPTGLVSASVLSSPLQGQAQLTTNGVAGSVIDLGLEAGDTPTFAGINANGASFALATATATAIQIGGGSATVTIPGNLTINGTTTIINTTNTAIKDQFILLASGSTGTMDGGIIVGNSATINVGEAFYWENNPGTTGRWAIASAVDATSTTVTPNSYMVTVSGSNFSGAQPTAAPTYGGSTNGIGNMFIDTSLTGNTDNNIWIYA